jgi:two-component system nitrate/nitrite response regulator NarL
MLAMIVDDHVLFAEAVRPTLESLGLEVRLASGGAEALHAARQERPDLVFLDVILRDGSGLAWGRRLLEEFPTLRVIALTSIDDPDVMAEALQIGFQGYLTKDLPVAKFANSVRVAIDGEVVIPKRLAKAVGATHLNGNGAGRELVGLLTPREREVLRMLVEAASGPEIARTLSISRNTVRTHIQSILTKLQVHSRLEAAAFAVRAGVLPVGGR